MEKSKPILNNSFAEYALDKNIEDKLKRLLMLILKDIDYVCKLDNIHYSLCAGSVLGAVRHKGIIPWDDDIDLMMFERDIKKLKASLNIHFPKKYSFLSEKKYNDDPLKFEKIMLTGTKYVEIGTDGLKNGRGIGIDIFQVINLPNNKIFRWLKGKIFNLLSPLPSLHFFTFSHSKTYKNKAKKDDKFRKFYNKRLLMGLFTFFLPTCAWKWLSTKAIFHNIKHKTIYSSIPYGSKRYFGEMHKTLLWNELIYVDFEGNLYPIPKNWKEYLSSKYGTDYMSIPDDSKKEKHFAEIIDFGPYENI